MCFLQIELCSIFLLIFLRRRALGLVYFIQVSFEIEILGEFLLLRYRITSLIFVQETFQKDHQQWLSIDGASIHSKLS